MSRSALVVAASVFLTAAVVWLALAGVQLGGESSASQALTDDFDSGLIDIEEHSNDLTELLGGVWNPDNPEDPIPYDIIVVGIPTAVLRTYNEPTPTAPAGGYPDSEEATEVAEAFSEQLTDYLISVEQVFVGDGLISSEKPLIVTMYGEHPSSSTLATQDAGATLPMNEIGQRYLFLLTESIDSPGNYFARDRSGGRLRLTGPVVTYSDGDRSPVAFARFMSPDRFVSAVATGVATMYAPAPTR